MTLTDTGLNARQQIEYIKKHGKTGAFAYLFLPLVLYFITDLNRENTFSFTLFAAFICALVVIRIGLCLDWMNSQTDSKKWFQIFDLVFILKSLSVGFIGPVLFSRYQIFHFQIQFYIIIIAIFSLGMIMSYAVRPKICWLSTALMVFPTALSCIFQSDIEGSSLMSLGIFSFWIFGIVQSKHLYQNQLAFHQKQEAIEYRDRRLIDFINTIPGLVIWVDADLKLQDINENFLSLLKQRRELLIGKTVDTANMPRLILEELKSFVQSQKATHTTEVELSVELKPRTYLSVFTRHQNASAGIFSMMSIDITDIKNKEHEVESQRLQLIENEKMISLGQMAGSIAHEVNNPLAIITGKAHVIIHKIDHQQTDMVGLREYAKHIYDTAFRIKKIIESLRLLANEGRVGTTSGYCLKDVIQPVLDITQSKIISQQIELRIEHEHPEAQVDCGLIEMGQVLMNLIVNAIHATEFYDTNKWIRIQTSVEDNKAKIRFSDCGGGIPEDVQKKLFTPFFTTKGLEKGTGIGLSLSRKLIQKQGGDLYYDSKCENTTFVIELPLVEKSIQKAS